MGADGNRSPFFIRAAISGSILKPWSDNFGSSLRLGGTFGDHFGSILKPWRPHERPLWHHGDSLGGLGYISGSLVFPGGHFGADMASQMGALGRQGCQIEPQSELILQNWEVFSSILDERSDKSDTKYGIPLLGHIVQYFWGKNSMLSYKATLDFIQ